MESGEEAICEEYESSLEDLSFNSKPLINVLTMLAEENSQYASSITQLIANRIYQVPQQTKLPSLYLLDSIVKNVGGEYLHLVAQIMEKTFTCVFEKADEKTRRDLFKLRNTWAQYFPPKMLYDLDVAVNKHDPGWPIPPAPPPSPSIHINPKFLKKAESAGTVASLTAGISTPQEQMVVEDHQQRLDELERLQEEQLKLTELEIQEHQMKRDLLLKKQQQERKLLLQQQQQHILHLRLQPEDQDSTLSNGPPVRAPVSTKAESTKSVQGTSSSRDPRLRRSELESDHLQEPMPLEVRKPDFVQERKLIDTQGSLPISARHGHVPSVTGEVQFKQTLGRPPEQFFDPLQPDLEAAQTQEIRSLQHMARVQNPVENVSRNNLDREVTGSPKYGDLQRPSKPKQNHKRRNSGDWSSPPPSHENRPDEPPKAQVVRGKARRGRRRSAEKQRERGKGERGRGRAREPMIRGRDIDNEQFQNAEFQSDQRFGRRPEQRDPRHPVVDRQVEETPPFRDNWSSERGKGRGNDQSRPGMGGPERPPVRDRLAPKDFRGGESPMHNRDEFIRAGSPGMHEKRSRGIGQDRRRVENVEHFSGPEMREDPEFRLREEMQRGFDPRERNHPPVPFHDDPRDQPVGEPLLKKPRPLLSDVEINELRNKKGASPNTGRMTPPPVLQEGFPIHPFERPIGEPMDVHPHPLHAEHPFPREHGFHQNLGPPGSGMPGEFRPHTPPMQQHPGEWAPGFEIPRELMLDRQNEIMIQAERRLQAGDLTIEQHHDLVDKLEQLYELQRHPDPMRLPPQDARLLPHPEHEPRHMWPSRVEEPPFRPGGPMDMQRPPTDAGPGRPMPQRFDGPSEHPRMPFRGPMEPQGPMMRNDGPRFQPNEPEMRRLNEDFRGPPPMGQPPMELDHHLHARPLAIGPPPVRADRPFEGNPRMDGGPNPNAFVPGRPVENIPRHPTSHENSPGSLVTPSTPPRPDKGPEANPPHTPNTMMEKKSVDDLFRRLMQVGIIKVTAEPGNESPRHAPSPGPPQAEIQKPQPLPVLPISLPGLTLPAAAMPKKEPPKVKPIPEIKLVPEELKRRHDGVISTLYDGTQCSSCGLRFPGEAAKIYREHLDWHFRKNRREKDGRRVAHKQWFFTVKDWLNYEEISDPEERARSSFFDVSMGAVDSPDPLKETKEVVGEGSCPVLSGDTEAEAECDICCEKFEQFWEETNEEWHYKAAVRIDGKTYHYLCYQDVKENQMQTEEDDNEEEKDEEKMDTSVEEKSPEKEEAKTEVKAEEGSDGDDDAKIPETKESSENKPLEGEKTDKLDEESSEKDSCKVEGVVNVSSNAVENKENETEGDDK
ncbi:uncharacterized protein LOC144655193 [Oculina patagonica]